MISQIQFALLPVLLSCVVGDYLLDLNTYHTYYPDYSDAYNNSLNAQNQQYKRVINVDNPISEL